MLVRSVLSMSYSAVVGRRATVALQVITVLPAASPANAKNLDMLTSGVLTEVHLPKYGLHLEICLTRSSSQLFGFFVFVSQASVDFPAFHFRTTRRLHAR